MIPVFEEAEQRRHGTELMAGACVGLLSKEAKHLEAEAGCAMSQKEGS